MSSVFITLDSFVFLKALEQKFNMKLDILGIIIVLSDFYLI